MLLASAGLAALVADSRSPELGYSQDPVNVVDADAVVALLRERARPGDTVVYGVNADPALDYYFKRYGIQGRRAQQQYVVCATAGAGVPCPARRRSGRAFVVVTAKPEAQTVGGNLAGAGLDEVFPRRPRVVRAFPWTRLYVVGR